MKKEGKTSKFRKYVAEMVWLFLFIYLSIAILPTILMNAGHEDAALKVHSVYRIFCHQRVERSMFLFGSEGMVNFYSIEELQERDALPDSNPKMPIALANDIFGYPYIGNEDVGYKVALCIRDMAMYAGILITGLIYLIYVRWKGKIVKFDWRFLIILMIPMAVDGTFQLIAEIFKFPWVPDAYFASISKRVISGGLFGISFALMIFSNLKESGEIWYDEGVNGPSEPTREKPEFKWRKNEKKD